ncbi:glutathionylspermidine synthase family protein [Cupriavidus basilensis]
MFPGHPNLLEASFSEGTFAGRSYARKPFLSREGESVSLVTPQGRFENPGEYGEEGFIYQAYAPAAATNVTPRSAYGLWMTCPPACACARNWVRSRRTPASSSRIIFSNRKPGERQSNGQEERQEGRPAVKIRQPRTSGGQAAPASRRGPVPHDQREIPLAGPVADRRLRAGRRRGGHRLMQRRRRR